MEDSLSYFEHPLLYFVIKENILYTIVSECSFHEC